MAHRRSQRGSDILKMDTYGPKWIHMGPELGENLPRWTPSKILAMASGRATPASCSPLTVWVLRPELAGRAASMDSAIPYPVHFESIRCARPLLLRSRRIS
jgi:hypothetical protein